MRAPADCNNIKACLPVAAIYFVFDGIASRGVSDDFWIQRCVRELELGRIRIDPLTALEFVSIGRSSTDVCPFVFDAIASSSSGSIWTQLQLGSLHN